MAKFEYKHVVQGNYGPGGWEDLSEENDPKEAEYLLGEYRMASPGYPHRVIKRRVKKEVEENEN